MKGPLRTAGLAALAAGVLACAPIESGAGGDAGATRARTIRRRIDR